MQCYIILCQRGCVLHRMCVTVPVFVLWEREVMYEREGGHVWRENRYRQRRAVGDGRRVERRREERGMEGDSTGVGG